MTKHDSASFTHFLREQRRRLTWLWAQSEERIIGARSASYNLETRKAAGTAPLVNGPSRTNGVHKIGGGYGGMAPAVYGVDDRDTNEGWR